MKVTQHNYPNTIQVGNVYNLHYENGILYKNCEFVDNKWILGDIVYRGKIDCIIGGSPCTYWSIAKNKNRETTCSGLGWELFMQYKRLLNECNPKYFLYENNNSISKTIKEEISNQLNVEYICIDSATVSAQHRDRCYWTNIPNVEQPQDRHIYFKDVINKYNRPDMRPIGRWMLEGKFFGQSKFDTAKDFNTLKSHTLTTKKGHPINYYLNDNHTMYSNLTADEWEILQTLPQGYTNCVKDSERYKCIGNGWTVDVIVHILKSIMEI